MLRILWQLAAGQPVSQETCNKQAAWLAVSGYAPSLFSLSQMMSGFLL